MEPSETDIFDICSITGLDVIVDRSLVIRALKAKNLRSEAVLNEFFDDAEKFRQTYRWDENAFSADREGATQTAIPSFTIHSEDQGVIQGVVPNNWYEANSGAPSRPPSRVNTRSPLGRVVELTADRATGPSSREQEDADLQRAIAESVAVSGRQTPLLPEPQQSGVTDVDTSKPHFGPANRNDYEHNQWAMVTVAKEREEPGPLGRKREQPAPAFLRCRRTDWAKHRLGSLVTIYHAIPTVRNALLRLGVPAENYGYDAAWWKGKAIVPALVPNGEGMWDAEPQPDFAEELHRLMAFLDETDRAYGTADVLAEIRVSTWQPSEPEADFMDTIKALDQTTPHLVNPLMAQATIVSVAATGADEGDDQAREPDVSDWNFLRSELHKEQWPTVRTMYHLWDIIFLVDNNGAGGAPPETSRMAIISKIPGVLTIAVGGDGLSAGFDVPLTFWVDRYLPEHKEEMVRLQLDMRAARVALDRAQNLEQQLTHWTPPGGGAPVDRRALARKVIDQDKQRLWQVQAAAQWRRHEELRGSGTDEETNYIPGADGVEAFELTPDEDKLRKHYEGHISLYEEKLADIDAKLQRLNAEKEACETLLRTLQRHRTVPSEEDGWHPVHKYTLRGVAASPDVMYLCRRAEPDLMEMEGASTPAEAWWKLGYVAEDDEPVKVERTTFKKAIEETCGEGSNPVLVYASDAALDEEPVPLSEPLKNFVKLDNRTFRQELSQDSPRDKKRGPLGSPSSPSKRLNRSTSLDSMASNHASIGDSDDDMLREDTNFDGVGADDRPDLFQAPPPPPPPPQLGSRNPFRVGAEAAGAGGPDLEMLELVDTSVPAMGGQQIVTPPDSLVDVAERAERVVDAQGDFSFESPLLGRQEAGPAAAAGGSQLVDGADGAGRVTIPAATENGTAEAPAQSQGQPEMAARGQSLPFVTRIVNGKVGGGGQMSVMDMDMDMDWPREAQAHE